MTLLSLLFCLSLLRLYDRLGRDWIGIEFLKGLRHYEGPRRWRQVLAWLVSRGDWMAFLVLSAKYDPFITMAYLRRGAYNGMAGRDWSVFMGSLLLANILWIFICYGGVSCLRLLF